MYLEVGRQQTDVFFFWVKESSLSLHGGAWGVGLSGRLAGPSQDSRSALKCPRASGFVHPVSFTVSTGEENKPRTFQSAGRGCAGAGAV